MRQVSGRRFAVLFVVAAWSVAGAAAGCSLGLDKSLLTQEAGIQDAPSVEVGVDAPMKPPMDAQPQDVVTPPEADAGACTRDSDCQSAVGDAGSCVKTAKCDPTWHVCMLDTCDVGACKAAVCNVAQQTCSVPTTYGFSTTQFSVHSGGVGGAPHSSIAAAWPFVFVVTTNGVAAYDLIDPTDPTPPSVTVHGVPFLPVATIAIGRRVYFTTSTEGGGPTYRQAIAWIDVPQNPFVTDLQATSALVSTPQQGVQSALTNGTDGLFVVYSSGSLLPTADVHPPLDDTTTLTPFSNAGLASGATIPAASGARLVAYRYDGPTSTPNFALVNGAGTTGAQTTAEQALDAFGPLANQAAFGTGGDGSLLWTTAVYQADDAGVISGIDSARLSWLLGSGTAANFDTTVFVDLETYTPTTGAYVVAPPLWIDANTALGLAAAGSTTTNSTSVQVVTKQPAAVRSSTRTLLSVGPGAVGAASSNGFGYVLAEDDPKNETCSVYVFAPACATGDN